MPFFRPQSNFFAGPFPPPLKVIHVIHAFVSQKHVKRHKSLDADYPSI